VEWQSFRWHTNPIGLLPSARKFPGNCWKLWTTPVSSAFAPGTGTIWIREVKILGAVWGVLSALHRMQRSLFWTGGFSCNSITLITTLLGLSLSLGRNLSRFSSVALRVYGDIRVLQHHQMRSIVVKHYAYFSPVMPETTSSFELTEVFPFSWN
jgi:hypothetical protein